MHKSLRATFTALATALALGAPVPALAETSPSFAAAMAAYERGDDAVAFAAFKTLAEADHVQAIEMLADMYYYGEGTPKDNAAGYKWSQRGAELGSAEAEYDIGASLANGEVGPVDGAAALVWIRRAAEHGSAKAQTTLARYQFRGYLMPRDDAGAIRNLRLAVAQGYHPAMYDLGMILTFGPTSRASDVPEGAHWLSMASEQRYAPALVALGTLSFLGLSTPRDMVLGMMWTELAAREGCLAATARVASLRDQLSAAQFADAIGMADAWDAAHPPRPLHDHQKAHLASGICTPDGATTEG